MRTHILILLIALIATACASKREPASTENWGQTEHQRAFDGLGSRSR